MSQSKPLRRPDILSKQAGRETILYRANSEAVHILNSTAQFIWNLCDGTHTAEEIGAALQANFAVPPDRDVLNAVRQTLDVFAEKDLLNPSSF